VIVEGYFGGWETPWRGLSSEAWREIHAALGGRASGIAVETGANREFAARHGIEVIPAVLVFSDGEVVARFSGRVRPAQVIEAVQSARKRAQRTAADLRELAAIETTEEQRSPVRSILRRRSQEPELLARAG
jgi:thioredoxin-like negative regulator of GroEL